MPLLTHRDLIEHAVDYLGGRDSVVMHRDVRSAIQTAYRELGQEKEWSYLLARARIEYNAPYSTGTIAYDHTGNALGERVATLSGGVWPSWADNGQLKIDITDYDVVNRIDDTHIQLSEIINPGADVAAGTAYTLYQSAYVLPEDFIRMDTPLTEGTWYFGQYVHPSDWLALERYGEGEGYPLFYTIMGDPRRPGRHVMRVYPYPTSSINGDYIYHRRARSLRITGYSTADSAGTVTISGTALVGTGTSFASVMKGAVIRLGSDSRAPTGMTGTNPWGEEVIIREVTDANNLVLFDAPTGSYSDVGYYISDPVDVDQSLLTALLRMIERELAIAKGFRNVGEITILADRAIMDARAADARNAQLSSAYGAPSPYTRLAYWPIDFTQS